MVKRKSRKHQLRRCRTAASQSHKFIPPWNMTANACARQPRRPNTTTRREHTIPQQDKATHVSNHREHRRRISAPAGHRNPATTIETRTPVVRVCTRRLVAPINTTDQRTALTSGSTLAVGSIDSMLYPESDWSPAPLSITHQGDQVILSAHQEWPNVVSLFGPRFGRLDLLVVPPPTEPAHAYNAMTTAASVNDASTPDQLLGTGTRRAGDPLLSPVALQRWESDGGAVPAPRSQAQMQDA